MLTTINLNYFDKARKVKSNIILLMLLLLTFAALLPLFGIFFYVVQQGIIALNWNFFTELPKPIGESGGGMANAIVGSIKIVGAASLVGIPWGVAAGIYLAEFGHNRAAELIRISADLLASVPSIVVGLFAYAMLVVPLKGFSGFAGAGALVVIMLPTIARSTEEIIRRVPTHIREAGLALGLPQWKVITFIVLKTAFGGIITASIIAVARISGETAPLLFTAFNNQFWSSGLSQPTASLPVQIYTYAISPFEDWHNLAWTGAFVLIMLVFILNLLTRVFVARRFKV